MLICLLWLISLCFAGFVVCLACLLIVLLIYFVVVVHLALWFEICLFVWLYRAVYLVLLEVFELVV